MGKAKKVKKAVKKPSKKVAGPKAGGLVKKAASVGMSLVGGASPAPSRARGGGGRRRRGPEYWAKKVIVERLKKKYWRVKYGGR